MPRFNAKVHMACGAPPMGAWRNGYRYWRMHTEWHPHKRRGLGGCRPAGSAALELTRVNALVRMEDSCLCFCTATDGYSKRSPHASQNNKSSCFRQTPFCVAFFSLSIRGKDRLVKIKKNAESQGCALQQW